MQTIVVLTSGDQRVFDRNYLVKVGAAGELILRSLAHSVTIAPQEWKSYERGPS